MDMVVVRVGGGAARSRACRSRNGWVGWGEKGKVMGVGGSLLLGKGRDPGMGLKPLGEKNGRDLPWMARNEIETARFTREGDGFGC